MTTTTRLDPAEPRSAVPPFAAGEADEDALTRAIAAEDRTRLACGPKLTARALARASLRILERNRQVITESHDAELGERLPVCSVCWETIHLDDDDQWVHS